MTPSRTIPFIVATIFMDAVGFGIIMPVLPQLVMEVGELDLPHAIEVGAWIGLVMAVATFLASPVLGNLSDHFGRRRVLLLALGGLAVDYALLTIVETLPWLFVARALSGIFGGSYAAAQAAIADITAPEDRARNFGVVGAAIGGEVSQGRLRREQVARHDRAVRQPGLEPPALGGPGTAERLPVGRPGRLVADRGQQVGPQRQRPGPVRLGGVRADRVRQGQRLAVGAEGGLGLGRLEQMRHGVRGHAARQQVVADARGRGAKLDQPTTGVAVDLAAPVRRDGLGQRLPDEAVTEPVARGGGLDEFRGQGVVEVAEGLLLGQPGQRDELVGVETGSGHGYPLEDLAGSRPQPGQQAGLEGLGPARCRAA
jgi:hypothetical protein